MEKAHRPGKATWRCATCGTAATTKLDKVSPSFSRGTCSNCGKVRMFSPATAPSTADENSQAAASSVTPVTSKLRLLVLRTIHSEGRHWEIGVSTDWLERFLDLPGNTVRPRVWELHKAGLIVRTGKVKTPSKRDAWTYRTTEAGEAVIEAAA